MLKKKVLFVYHVSSIGGGSFALLNILKNIDRCEIEPLLLLRNDGPLAIEAKKLDIKTLFMPSLRRVPYNESVLRPENLRSTIELLLSLNDFDRIIKETKPDVVYINTMMMYPYLSVAKNNGVKTVIHIREHWPEQEHKFQRKIALKSIAEKADQIIAINTYSSSMLSSYGVTPTIVYDWIDMNDRDMDINLSDLFNENLDGKKVFLYMGGVQKSKGAYQVLKCFTSDLTNENYRLLTLGIPERYTYKGIKGRISKFLSIFGCKTYEEKVIELAHSDNRILCAKSIYELKHIYEQVYCILSYFTIPHANLALAESIICNTVNIAALTEESLEYSNNGELALLFKENNINDFKKKVSILDDVYPKIKKRLRQYSHCIQSMFDPITNIEILNGVLYKI